MRKPFALLAGLSLALLGACGTPQAGSSVPQAEALLPASSVPVSSLPATEPEDSLPPVGTATPLPADVMESIVGVSWTEDAPVALEDLAYLTVPYVDFAGETQVGAMVVNATLAEEILDIFAELYEAGFPIALVQPIDAYGADDLASMAANNSSAFCARLILGTDRWSVHSYGAAVDINPVQNPYVTGGTVYPAAAEEYLGRDDVRPGMVVAGDVCHTAFTSRGWRWGGDWQNPDYQHFEKDVAG